MRSVIYKSAILPAIALLARTFLAFMASVGFSTITHAGEADRDVARARPGLEDIDTTGSIGHPASTLPLSDEQRGLVFLGVTSLPDVPVVDGPAPPMSSVVPASIDLQDVPAMVVSKVPHVRDHKFVKFEDYILIVRSADRVVVADIPLYRLLH
jgi:hypothetical protein